MKGASPKMYYVLCIERRAQGEVNALHCCCYTVGICDVYTKGVVNTCPFSHKGKKTSLCSLWWQIENYPLRGIVWIQIGITENVRMKYLAWALSRLECTGEITHKDTNIKHNSFISFLVTLCKQTFYTFYELILFVCNIMRFERLNLPSHAICTYWFTDN